MRWMVLSAAALALGPTGPTLAWDSAKFEILSSIIHPTHSYLTEYALDELDEYAELGVYRRIIIEGANTELHELPVEGFAYGLDLDAKRREHKGTNAGSDDVAGWWQDAKAAYAAGDKQQAWFIVGVILHMIEDMGVPAHANGVYHQGTLTEFDNFEAMALQAWEPNLENINRKDPGYSDPADYYRLSQDWASADAPDYRDRDSFPKTWFTASAAERRLVRNRQARTATVALWALRSMIAGFRL